MNLAEQEHFDKYQSLAEKLGWAELLALVPVRIEALAYWLDAGDRHLNTAGNQPWDIAALGSANMPGTRGEPIDPLWPQAALRSTARDKALPWHKLSGLSLCDRCCALKHVARVEADMRRLGGRR